MFPWAINVVELGYAGLFKMFVFMGLLFAGLIYIYKKKALSWDLSYFKFDKYLNYCIKIQHFLKNSVSLKRFENHE